MKCGRCGAEINGNKCSAMSLTPQYPHSVWENRWMLLCEKCSAGLVQWLASGDPIQARKKTTFIEILCNSFVFRKQR